jgi:hypothetical protein
MAVEGLGEAWVDVHARVEDFDKDLETGLKKELAEADKVMDKGGKDLGETLSKSLEKEAGSHGTEIGKTVTKSVEEGIKKEAVDFEPNWRYNRRGKNGQFIKRVAGDIEEDISEAFTSTLANGLFKNISKGLADAIGAGFNVPGNSPLISVLIPAVGALGGLIVGAIQAVNALGAALATLPALIGGVALQAGVLLVAFHGIGDATKNAFAAKNATELKKALEGLTGPAQEFIKSLLPLKDFFDQLQHATQFSFFKNLNDVIPKIQAMLQGPLIVAFSQVADALGGLFREVGLFFASAEFKGFIQKIAPSVVKFLNGFGPEFITFLQGLIAFAEATIPFLDRLGAVLGNQLGNLGDKLLAIANDPKTQDYFNDMFWTIGQIIELTKELGGLLVAIFAQVNDSAGGTGGTSVLDEIITDITMIKQLLASDFGQKAIEGLIHVVTIALQVFTGLILLVVLLSGLLEVTAEFIKYGLLPAIGDFFSMLGGWIAWVWHGAQDLWNGIVGIFNNFVNQVSHGRAMLMDAVAAIPGMLRAALGNIGNLLYDSGRAMIQGFINGLRSMLQAVKNAAQALISAAAGFFPGSPAEEGPLSGRGYSKFRGQRFVQDFAEGMRMEMPDLAQTSSEAVSNIVFGAGSIKVGFNGALPTQDQATSTGNGVATGIMGGLAARNTRLAVRTI